MRADKLDKRHLADEVESDDQAVGAARDFEADPLAIERLAFRRGL